MEFRQTSFWRNYLKRYPQYMAVGVAAIPAGVLYAFIASRGYGSRWTALLAIVLGCRCARQAWKFVDRKFAPRTRKAFAFEYAFMESTNALPDIIMRTQAGETILIWAKSTVEKEIMTASSRDTVNLLPVIESSNRGTAALHAIAGT